MSQFFEMGGYAAFVWPAYAVTLAAIVLNIVWARRAPAGERFRLGGMVTQGSLHRAPGSLEVRFVVTDFSHDVPVSYTGVLPDLFREGAGVVAHGHMRPDGTFVADEVLAKHDEKYMPPEVDRKSVV